MGRAEKGFQKTTARRQELIRVKRALMRLEICTCSEKKGRKPHQLLRRSSVGMKSVWSKHKAHGGTVLEVPK